MPEVIRVIDDGKGYSVRILPTCLRKTKPDGGLTFELRGAPTMKPEQRAYRDETHNFEMPRQGVSLLNDSLGVMPEAPNADAESAGSCSAAP